jgi:Carboxypeptidase regulatory-like domain/TonB-dependent Receptor Plug Domain
MRKFSWVVLPLLIALCIAVPVYGQKSSGTITGIVTDPQGAVVPGAEVTITNDATGANRTVVTTSAGLYSAPSLDQGTYTVSIKAANFQDYVAKNVTLDVNTTTTVNASLKVGNASEQVTVEGSAVQVETTNGTVGNTVNGTEVRELPLNGNNFMELTQLMPGVSSMADFNTVKKGLEGNSDFSVNGNAITSNIFMVDGVNNNDIGSNRTILVYPSIQAIDEFTILRNSFGAEYGQASGAIINIVTKSGTNQWHGGASYFGRNTALNSTDYFTHELEASNPLITKAPIHRNDILFNINGPIVKDKLFFFWSEEWDREIRGATYAALVPTLAERSGNFSAPYPGGGCNGGTVSPTYSSSGSTFPGATTFTGNVIPTNDLSPAGLNYLGNWPLPNLSNITDCANWAANESVPVNWREDHVRMDYNIAPTWKLFGRYTRDTWQNPAPSTLSYWGEDEFPAVQDGWTQPSSQATAKLTKLIGPSAVNDLQISFAANAITVNRAGTGVGGNYYTSPANAVAGSVAPSLGPNAFVASFNELSLPYFPLTDKAFPLNSTPNSLGQPGFWGDGPTGIHCAVGVCGTFGQQGPWHNNEQLLILKDDFSKVIGAHTFRAGFIGTQNQKNQRDSNESLTENDAYWSNTADSWGGPASSGNGVFDLLNAGTQWGFGENSTNLFEYIRWHDFEFYGADNWKIRRNVTIDYGLRWSFIRNPYSGTGQLGYFEPQLFNPTLSIPGSACNGMLTTRQGLAACAAAGLPGGTLGTGGGLLPNNNKLIQPRIGIAWDVRGDGKTAIRAGFGTFYNRFFLNTVFAANGNPPFVFGLPSSVGQRGWDTAPAFAGVLGSHASIGQEDNDRIPEAIQYNLSIEHELWRNTKLEVGYVGNQGRFLQTFTNANAPIGLTQRIAYAESSWGGNQVQSLTPFGPSTAQGGLASWGAISLGNFNGTSHYDSLQALFKTRMKVVDAQFAYTYSKSLTNTDIGDSSGTLQTNNGGTGSGNFVLANDAKFDYGPSELNRPNIFSGSLVYNTPALAGRSALMRYALGTWETSAIMQYASGPSINVYAGVGQDLVGAGEDAANRPNLVSGQSCRPGSSPEDEFLNSAMFTVDHYQIGSQPSTPRGVCLGPGLAQTDFSIRKNFKITERVNARFSMDFFNLFNKTQFLPTSVQDTLNVGGTVTLCNPTAGTAQGGQGQTCAGYGPDTVQWIPTPGVTSYQLNHNMGVATQDRPPRQIQYGMQVSF